MESIITTLVILMLALMIPGVINRSRAILSGRKGIRFMQHIYNVELLLKKGSVYSPTTTMIFKIAPVVYVGAAFTALLFIPVGNFHPMFSFNGDVVMFAYLLALSRVVLILAAMDTGSSFEGMGASREALYGAMVEPALLIVIATMAIITGQTSFEAIFSGADLSAQIVMVPALLTYVLIKILTVEAGRVPLDDPRTHLELTMIHEVMILDYSGIDLALINIGGWFKMAAFAVLAANSLAAVFSTNLAVVCGLTLCVGVFVGFVESFQARNRLSKNTTFILTIVALAFVVFFVAFLLLQNIVIE